VTSQDGRGERRVQVFLWGSLKERDHWGDQDVNWRIILRWIFRMWDVGIWTLLGWLRIQTGGGHI
jgi:hypothetical protein